MHKKEFWILTDKCGNNLKHENEDEEPWPFSLVFVFKIISTLLVKIQNSFLCKCWRRMFCFSNHSPCKQTWNPFNLRWSEVENRVSPDVITGKVYCWTPFCYNVKPCPEVCPSNYWKTRPCRVTKKAFCMQEKWFHYKRRLSWGRLMVETALMHGKKYVHKTNLNRKMYMNLN